MADAEPPPPQGDGSPPRQGPSGLYGGGFEKFFSCDEFEEWLQLGQEDREEEIYRRMEIYYREHPEEDPNRVENQANQEQQNPISSQENNNTESSDPSNGEESDEDSEEETEESVEDNESRIAQNLTHTTSLEEELPLDVPEAVDNISFSSSDASSDSSDSDDSSDKGASLIIQMVERPHVDSQELGKQDETAEEPAAKKRR